MPRKCAAGCRSGAGVILHSFPDPIKYPERFRIWVNITGGKLESPSDYDYYRRKKMCDIHFTASDKNRNKRLTSMAVPSLHVSGQPLGSSTGDQQEPNSPDADVNIFRVQAGTSAVGATLTSSALKTTLDASTSEVGKHLCEEQIKDQDHNYCTNKSLDKNAVDPDAVVGTLSDINLPTRSRAQENENNIESYEVDNLGDIRRIPLSRENNSLYFGAFEESDMRLHSSTSEDNDACEEVVELSEEQCPFSWQKFTKEVVTLDADETVTAQEDVTLCGEAQLVPDIFEPFSQTQEEYSCNICNERISGFRYACLECINFDLCGACEARGQHAQHYVLRAPPERSHSETQSVLAALREMLAGLLQGDPDITLVKDEVKTEDPLAEVEAQLPLEAPDQPADTQQILEDDLDTSGIEGTDKEGAAVIFPATPQKRKLTPLCADIRTFSPKKRKNFIDGIQKSSVITVSAIHKKKSSQIETDDVLLLDDAISNTILASSRLEMEQPTESSHVQILETCLGSMSDDQFMVLEVIGTGNSRELRVNLTKLSADEIRSATQQGRIKR